MSVINIRYKHVFIHVPKTAGTSMEEETFVGGRSHESAQHLLDRVLRLGKNPDDFFWWGFVRDPIDRFLSWWGHLNTDKAGAIDFKNSPFWEWRGKKVDDFLDWLYKEDWPNLIERVIHLVPQHKFLTFEDVSNAPGLFVGKFENLDEDWMWVCESIGVPHRRLPLKRKSERPPKRDLSIGAQDILAEIYYEDFERFGYEY